MTGNSFRERITDVRDDENDDHTIIPYGSMFHAVAVSEHRTALLLRLVMERNARTSL